MTLILLIILPYKLIYKVSFYGLNKDEKMEKNKYYKVESWEKFFYYIFGESLKVELRILRRDSLFLSKNAFIPFLAFLKEIPSL